MKINWKVRFKNPVFWFKLAGCRKRALTGRPEPCNRGVGPGIRMEPVKRPHYKRPKRFQPGAYLYRT